VPNVSMALAYAYRKQELFPRPQADPFRWRLLQARVRLPPLASGVQLMREGRCFFFRSAACLARPCAARRRLRWVMLITTPKCSWSSFCSSELGACGLARHHTSSHCRSGERIFEGCPCLTSWQAASPRLPNSCPKRGLAKQLSFWNGLLEVVWISWGHSKVLLSVQTVLANSSKGRVRQSWLGFALLGVFKQKHQREGDWQ
jgi:hypothetical protein